MTTSESHTSVTPAKKKYFVVSSDCHVHEPLDLWERHIEPKFRHRIPRLETDANGKRWLVVEGMRRTRVRDCSPHGIARESREGAELASPRALCVSSDAKSLQRAAEPSRALLRTRAFRGSARRAGSSSSTRRR